MTPDDTYQLIFGSSDNDETHPAFEKATSVQQKTTGLWQRQTVGEQQQAENRNTTTASSDECCPVFDISGLSPFETGDANFRVEDSLGVGGMGTVHSANQLFMMREVAVKRSHESQGNGPTFDSVIEEGRRFGRLDHPNIPPVHMVGKDGTGHAVLVMKRIDGSDLYSMLQNPKHERWEQVDGDRRMWTLDVIIQISRALEHAHSRDVLHRDIKSDNVMIGDFGQIFLIDWGISVDLSNEEMSTTTSKFIGSPCFAAPEMVIPSSRLKPTTDVYLLGALLFEVLTGTVPRTGHSINELLSKARSKQPITIPPSIPPSIGAIIAKAMEPNPEDRYTNASEFRIAVQQYKSNHFLLEQLQIAETQVATLRKWLRERRTDRQTGYNFMTLAHEALANLKTVIRGGVRVKYAQQLVMENIRIQTEYSILQKQFGVAKSLMAKLVDELGPNVPWINDLAGEIAQAQAQAKGNESELQTQSLAIMFEKMVELQQQANQKIPSSEEE